MNETSPPTEFVRRFADLPERDPRAGLRRTALDALGRLAPVLGRGASALARPRLQVLNLHHVFADEEEGFRALLGWLVRTGHDLVPYGTGVDRLLTGTLARPSVAFTFDDGLASCVRAARILEEFDARGCFFLATSMVGERDAERIARFAADRIHMPPVEFLDWDEVEALLAAGHEIGSHTHTHPMGSACPVDALGQDLHRSAETLRARCGEVRHFSWPYGRFHHFSAEAVGAVFAAGFETCASAERGAHVTPAPTDARRLCIRRDHTIAAWPLAHHRWFIGHAARRARAEDNLWPAGWRRVMDADSGPPVAAG